MLQECGQKLGVAVAEKDELLKSLKSAKNQKDPSQFYEKRIKSLKAEVQSLQSKLTSISDQISKNEVSIEQSGKELGELKDQLATESDRMRTTSADTKSLQQKEKEQAASLESLKHEQKLLDSSKGRQSEDLGTKTILFEKLKKEVSELQERREQTLKDIKHTETQAKDARSVLETLLKEHPWIAQERQFFGQSGHMFDFRSMDISAMKEEVKSLKASIEAQQKRVNFKVDSMFDDTQQQYNRLIAKKETIEGDKQEVKETIEFLNTKKNEELQKTWLIVNENCSEIFSTLLPGAMAKLVLADPEAGVEKGLELRVGFNDSWKQSLSELSGGQRSLLALSLILALLRYQPAPLYILDEIDSALDLSHTQNIGMMIKKFFKNSQFIIVSLKEGLFQNANVLFKTQFLDNRS